MDAVSKVFSLFASQCKKNHKSEGYTASEFKQFVKIKRNVISHYLNRLVEEGKLRKTVTRPVRFYLPENIADLTDGSEEITRKITADAFSSFIGAAGSLSKQVNLCKSAVMYPKQGLPVLISGNSGVGKSFLASLIHRYAVEQQVINADAPFVVFNCADYANNPELLSAALFGYQKGAFTGATQSKIGLIDSAEGGYLFLDEVHCLSSESQEKLFLLMDQGSFRRLGSNEAVHTANIRFIFATTENIDVVLLETFRRRIPLKITLTDFQDRPFVEKISLIQHFFYNEAVWLKKDIEIAREIFESIMFDKVSGNIGGLKNSIKVACACAFTAQNTGERIWVNSKEMQMTQPINRHFYEEASTSLLISHCSKSDNSFAQKWVDRETAKVLAELSPTDATETLLKKFRSILTTIHGVADAEETLLENQFVFQLVKEELDWLKEQFNISLSEEQQKIAAIIAIYCLNTKVDEKTVKELRKYSSELGLKAKIASEKLNFRLERRLGEVLPAFDSLVSLVFNQCIDKETKLQAIIIAHGKSTASSITGMANQVCGGYYFEPFDVPYKIDSVSMLNKVTDYIDKIDTRAGLIVLVDMGSLQELYEPIKSHLQGDLLLINNVTILMAIDIGMKIGQCVGLPQIIEDAKTSYRTEVRYYEGIASGTNIVISCISGMGIAKKIKEIFEGFLEPKGTELVTIDYRELKRLLRNSHTSMFRQTRVVLTTTDIDTKHIPSINIQEIIGEKNREHYSKYFSDLMTENQFDKMIDEMIKFFSIEGATARLHFLNPSMVINEVEAVIKQYETYYNTRFQSSLRMNLFLHTSLFIERMMIQEESELENHIELSPKQAEFVQLSQKVFHGIIKKYRIVLPVVEIMMIYEVMEPYLDSPHQ